jgi:SAM-dependent methyltransferase
MPVEFGRTALDYRTHRAGFPDSFFERLRPWGIGAAGQRVVDLGTGTGTLARGFARRGGRVLGIDSDPRMLEQARALDAEAGVQVEHRLARAEETSLPDRSADVVSAGQCWHWFDRAAAAREAARLLVHDGALLIAHFDWLPLAGNVVEATERLILAHNPGWTLAGGTGLYPRWLRELGEAGWRGLETLSYDVDVPYSAQAWRGRVRASNGVGATLAPAQVEAFDRALGALLARSFPGDPLQVPHRVFALLARPPAAAALGARHAVVQ